MNANRSYRSGWQAVVEGLHQLGVQTLFGLPSDDLHLLAALEERDMRMVLSRDQRNAMFMAIGHALAGGTTAVCVVGKGPAVTNTVTGLLEANAARVPVVLLATGTAAERRGTGAFQELDQLSIVRPLVKWCHRVDTPQRLGAALERAFFVAANGAPGPVYLELPEEIGGGPVPEREWRRAPAHRPAPDPDAYAAALAAVRRADRPMLLIGGGARHRNTDRIIERLAERLGAPMITTASGRGVVDEDHPHFCGLAGLYAHPATTDLWARTDLVVALGSRLEETATFGWEHRCPAPPVVQINVAEADVVHDRPGPIVLADVRRTVSALLEGLGPAGPGTPHVAGPASVRGAALAQHTDRLTEAAAGPHLRIVEILAAVQDLAPDRILVQENGLQDMWSYFWPAYTGGTFVAPSEQTSLGFGAAAAVGVSLAVPARTTVALVGDGAFNLFRSDLATAVEAGAGVLYVVLDNGGYGWLQQQLTQHSGGRSRFRFTRPRPVAGSTAGADGPAGEWTVRVADRDALRPALRQGLRWCRRGRPAVVVVDVRLDDVAPGLDELAGDFPAVQG
ncbi:thiamine pyrophosphate-binding protein [Krasilnikovia sp. M28-CT-15]|uniref:thiamine pyrophosphate-binding protein n=1 Tax=Krasilnikovia sp. M28-CT-15 TaxID=3373540 RepID=UPI0038775D57